MENKGGLRMSLYEKGTLRHLAKLNEWTPEQAQAFDQFNVFPKEVSHPQGM